jgi:hypothetical protein
MDIVMGNIEESVDRSLTLARAVETSTSETQREVRNDVYTIEEAMQQRFREMDTLIREIRNELEERIETILENPLNDVQ